MVIQDKNLITIIINTVLQTFCHKKKEMVSLKEFDALNLNTVIWSNLKLHYNTSNFYKTFMMYGQPIKLKVIW